MSKQPTNPDSTPLSRAYEAAHDAVTKALDLYRAVVHEEILDPDYYFAQEIDPAGTTYHGWVAGAFACLWNSIPEYQQTLEVVSPQLNVVRKGTIGGWRRKPHANAHEGCIDLAVVLCDEIWDCITVVRVLPTTKVRPRLEDWEVITQAVRRRELKLRKCLADLGDPSEIGPELLAAARIDRDKALDALQKNSQPPKKIPDGGGTEATSISRGGGHRKSAAARRSWTQPDLELAIRKYKAERASNYHDLVQGVKEGRPGARKSARRLFGRNAISNALGVKASSMVSKSPEWREIAKELHLEGKKNRRRKYRDFEREKHLLPRVAEEMKYQNTNQLPCPVVDEVINRETAILVRKSVPEKTANEVLEKLERGLYTDDQAREIAELAVEQRKDVRPRVFMRP
jgi:hypothetical protein